MDHGTSTPSPVAVFRPRTSAALVAGGWLIVAGVTTAHWVVAGPVAGLRSIPLATALGYLVWLTLWAPRLEVSDDDVLVVNPFRDIRVPWAALVHVSTQYAMTLVTPHGTYRAWAAPGPGRHKALSATGPDLAGLTPSAFDGRGAVQLGDLPGTGSGEAGELVRRRWAQLVESGRLEAGVADETPVEIRWHVRSLVALAAVGAIGLALVLL